MPSANAVGRDLPDMQPAHAATVAHYLGLSPQQALAEITPLCGHQRVLKRTVDLFGASAALILLSPLMLLIALLVFLTEGNHRIFFRQLRNGRGHAPFMLYKFRSMKLRKTAEASLQQATRRDARVTWIGRLLRRTSMDELAQLYNVLKGDMSLVGPRPHAVAHNDYYRTLIAHYDLRARVKPGITGWAQIHGWRGETDTPEKMRMRVAHDLYYIRHWSLALDLQILLRSAGALMHKNAY